MKTLKALGLVLALSGCAIYAGEVSVWDGRDKYITDRGSFPIDYYNEQGPKLIKSEVITDTGFAPNKLLTAYSGYPVVDTKSYEKNYYTELMIVAPQKAQLRSGLSPIMIEKGAKYDVIGHVTVDGNKYALVTHGASRDVFLIDNDGYVHPQIGAIRNDRLVMINNKYIIEPQNFRFESVANNKMVQSDMIRGFEIRYNGIKADRMVFTVMDYRSGIAGAFENIDFPNRPGIINIRGIKLKIFEANNSKLEYMIVTE